MTRLSTKGQLVIPREIRARHGWGSGTELEVEDRGESVVLRQARKIPRTKVEDLLGCLPYAGRPKTIVQMEAAIARGARLRR
ncbi:MAG: AbrB/MazE/SpoVT family DNA-binding domain-containing protein [Myxococcales bacterium]|nr:AbrB/MazE/SpoVT family DNA-binding domain-containing protein [Myxococcales bacterium]